MSVRGMYKYAFDAITFPYKVPTSLCNAEATSSKEEDREDLQQDNNVSSSLQEEADDHTATRSESSKSSLHDLTYRDRLGMR